MNELKGDMNKAGKVLKNAKNEIENELGRSVVTSNNFKQLADDNDK